MLRAQTVREFERDRREPDSAKLDRILESQARIEAKLDALLDALADEGEEMERPELTLDGEAVGGERDDSQPL